MKAAARVALVTGAGGGIGRAIALALAGAGQSIAVLDIDEAAAGATVEAVRATGSRAVALRCDVTDAAETARCAAEVVADLGGIDLLVNNAGILRTAPFLETSAAMWRQVFAVNLDGAFNMAQAVLPHMVARRAGCVVNIASWTGKKGVPNHAAYSASKFALVGLTQVLAGEMAAHGIRVNAVCPGIIVETGMRDQAERMNREQGLPDVATRVKAIPLQRAGQPGDVAGVVLFLASDAASYMTGQAINVTGGLWMG